jgi:hypothetical protein
MLKTPSNQQWQKYKCAFKIMLPKHQDSSIWMLERLAWLFLDSKFILPFLLDIGNWNPNLLIMARLCSCNIPRTLEHKNSVQNATSHVLITMNHAITEQGRHIWSSTQFSEQNLLPHVSNASYNIPLSTFHMYQNRKRFHSHHHFV